jgi:hypothetical protein
MFNVLTNIEIRFLIPLIQYKILNFLVNFRLILTKQCNSVINYQYWELFIKFSSTKQVHQSSFGHYSGI